MFRTLKVLLFRALLDQNFQHHYSTNRAPLSLSFDPSWLLANKGFTEVMAEWMDHLLASYNNEVYFVTELQVSLSNLINDYDNLDSIRSPRTTLLPMTPQLKLKDDCITGSLCSTKTLSTAVGQTFLKFLHI